MIGARVEFTTISHALFKRTEYKQGRFIEVFSYPWIPQPALYGAISFAVNGVLRLPFNVMERMHITSASVNCKRCNRPTVFVENKMSCGLHDPSKPKITAFVHTVPLNPATTGIHAFNYKGEFGMNRRMSPRRMHPIAPGQRFSLLAFFDDGEALDVFRRALRVLCFRVDGERGMGKGIGWGKKFWGKFNAEITTFKAREKHLEGVREAWLQSPSKAFSGAVWPTNGTVVDHTQVRNVHYDKEYETLRIFREGSKVKVADVTVYETDLPGTYIGFGKPVYRKVACEPVKAIEPSFLIDGSSRPSGELPLGKAPIEIGLTPFDADVPHPAVEEARRKAGEKLLSVFASLRRRDPATAYEKFKEYIVNRAKECEGKLVLLGVKAYTWKEMADALLLGNPKSWKKACIFCRAPAKYIKNLQLVSPVFGWRGRIGPTQVTASFWTNKVQGSERTLGVCPACLYALLSFLSVTASSH